MTPSVGSEEALRTPPEKVLELASRFAVHQSELRAKIGNSSDNIAMTPLIDAWTTGLHWAINAHLHFEENDAIAASAKFAEEALETYFNVGSSQRSNLLAEVAANLDVFQSVFDRLAEIDQMGPNEVHLKGVIAGAVTEARTMVNVMGYVAEQASQLELAVADAQNSARNAREALKAAKQTVSEVATTELEQAFRDTAQVNSKNATGFRWLTISILSITVLLGVFFALDHAPGSQDVDWYGIVYRLAVLSGLAAIAGYTARQSSHYRRMATWAKGIEIQLNAFLGFVNEVEDPEARQTMFALFSKRVLEAPPDGKSSDESVTNVIQPIIEQVAKARPTTG